MISNEINKLAAVTALSEDIRKWVPDLSQEIRRDGVEEVPPETFKKTVVMALTGLKKRVENEIEEYRKEGVETYNLIVMRTSKESDTGWETTKEEK